MRERLNRRVVAVDTSNQMGLALDRPEGVSAQPVRRAPVRFEEPDPQAIFINQIRLDEHLKQMGQRAPLKVREVLAVLSYEAFERAYHANGRPPYAPRAMIGLILYGIMRGISSLRDLEALARTDVGCWWVSGGIAPDHSIIGRFIRRHEALLTQAFFEEITSQVLKATHSKTTVVAGDGTVIEAAASRYRLMREDALGEAATAARAAAQAAPGDARQQRRLATLEQAQALLRSRQEGRAGHGRDPETVRIHPLEPEAVVQPQKDKKLLRASYKPQVLANEARVIVACDVHPSSETAIVPELLERAGVHGVIETSMHDTGYFSDAILECMASRGIELLCPEGQSFGKDWNKQSGKRYPKSRFVYDAQHDRYRCPGDQTLVPIERYRGNVRAPGYVQYATSACAGCALKAHCTRSDNGRRIKRYAGDAAKDALRAKMAQPQTRLRYSKRQAMIEPVFSHLRGRQRLNRFRRSGLSGVRVEFALHAMAYNLSRALVWLLVFARQGRRRVTAAHWRRRRCRHAPGWSFRVLVTPATA